MTSSASLSNPHCLYLTSDVIYADDTFNPKEIPFNGNNELTAACIITSEDLVIESHPEEEMVTCTAHASSERSDIDSVGQEITKSMMTVLLPRALPLLKTFTRKKKTESKPSEVSLYKKRSKKKNNKMDLVVDVASPGKV